MPQLAWIAGPDGKYLFRNKRWREYTGISLEDPADAGWRSAYHPDAVDRVMTSWREALETKKPFEIETRFRRADGEYHWFLLRAVALLGEGGSVLAWMGTCTDIHDQRLLHEEALRTAKMKDEFLATVSHELRTPLNAIVAWSHLLRTGTLPEEKIEKGLESVERNALAQARLVDDLIDVSRIVSGKMRLELSLANPTDAVEAALDAVRPAAIAKGVELSATIGRHDCRVLADPGRVQQIIWNLVGNAVKFTPKHGHVRVRVARAGSRVKIAVSDSGTGIKPEFLPHVFERFSQEDGSIRRSHGGLGLGLAIAKNLVELHGGDIQAESPGEGLGATFTVTLPLADPAVSQPLSGEQTPASSSPRAELRGLRLLLVEDDLDSMEVMAAMLSDSGVEVTSASTAERALELLDTVRVDVILSDVGLPGMDGYAFMRAVRNNTVLANTPAAALTAYAHVDDRRRALEAGFQMHLRKPFQYAELVGVVADLAKIAAAVK